jgi:hypothetical protein
LTDPHHQLVAVDGGDVAVAEFLPEAAAGYRSKFRDISSSNA